MILYRFLSRCCDTPTTKITSSSAPMEPKLGHIATEECFDRPLPFSHTVLICPAMYNIQQFWKLKAIGIQPEEDDLEDGKKAAEHFLRTVRRQSDERYIVGWP